MNEELQIEDQIFSEQEIIMYVIPKDGHFQWKKKQ